MLERVLQGLKNPSFTIDWLLFSAAFFLVAAGLITMNSFVGENYFFERQIVWTIISVCVFFTLASFDYRFLRNTNVIVAIFLSMVVLLLLVFVFGEVVKGAQSRFDLGGFAVQPADPAKLVLILVLAKYFTRRHIEIAHIRHILISGMYAFILFALVFLQPDFGSAIILAATWLGMVLVSGISKKHLAAVFLTGATIFSMLWFAPVHNILGTEEPVLKDYQKQRIMTFLNPLADLQGAGYNAYQSTIAVGSGQFFGKGIGYGTQSKLQFLPEYETDFIFAAFAEEWGFAGVIILFIVFGILIWRILDAAVKGATNFETLFGVGVAVLFVSHFVVHVGMNIGLLPVTGTTIPFMSYGGSHLLTEFAALGILMGMRRYARTRHREDTQTELIGV